MQSGWRVGSLFGIPLFIDPSWFFVLVLFALPWAWGWQSTYPHWGTATTYGAAVLMVLLLCASVLLHELGHSLVAKSQGIKVNSITLFLFGGIASIDRESNTPAQAFQVAIAGPAVSLGLFLLLSLVVRVLPEATAPASVIAQNLARLNLVLALFNLLPGLPLDGGQILKALVWKLTGNRFQGVHWAARTGRILGWTGIVVGLASLLTPAGGGWWLALIGWFILQNADSYDRVTELQEALLQIHAGEAMTREFRVVDANMTLRQFADEYLLQASAHTSIYFAASDGRYRGLVMVDELHYVERSQWESQTLYAIIRPLGDIPTVEETSSLVEVIQLMEAQELRRITVLSPAGAIAGVIDRGDIVRALAQKMNVQIANSIIKQIKEEGAYPPGFQLGTIAQAAAEAAASEKGPQK